MKALTIRDILAMKGKKKIVSLTAYDHYIAKYLDEAGVDLILIGDSINMVIYGEKNTLTLDMRTVCAHTKAVSGGVKHALVVADMPFLSFQAGIDRAVLNAGKLIQAGAGAIKLEGGTEMVPVIEAIIRAGIPVMGHIGMQPQSINITGGYRTMGKSEKSHKHLLESAIALDEAGCFSMVLEKVKPEVATEITEAVKCPTIGIGAGAETDGQVLVVNDILGLFDDFKPSFVRQYADLKSIIIDVAKRFSEDVRNSDFPAEGEV